MEAYLALCTVVKDQNEDVREWLDWHLALGVGRIYFFDNNSRAPMLAQMSDLVASGRVVYTFFAKHPGNFYTKCGPCLTCIQHAVLAPTMSEFAYVCFGCLHLFAFSLQTSC